MYASCNSSIRKEIAMVRIRTSEFKNFVLHNGLFTISVSHKRHNTHLIMSLHTNVVNTKYLPMTKALLRHYVPSVFYSKCFNYDNAPFLIESQQTEIGHLFEHILLEFLCHLKSHRGIKNPVHNGVTSWNWVKEKKGTFRITIDVGDSERDIFFLALQKSIEITNKILSSQAAFQPQNNIPIESLNDSRIG